jgi:cell division protein FtsQ
VTGMRRPSPLPPPPATAARPASREDTEASVIPFLAPAEPPAAPAVDDGPGDGAQPGDAPLDAGVAGPQAGMRDVWRAARARRKALRAEMRRFTARQRRRRMLWLGAAGAAVLLVGGTVGAAYSPLFAVQRIEVAGTAQLDADTVSAALQGQMGVPLPLVDSSEVKAALVAFPLVESYTLEARPPHDLVVRIVERTPVGVIESPAGFTLVDAAGVSLSTTPAAPEGQPLLDVTGGAGSAAFRAAGMVVRSLPADIRAQLTGVSASTADDVTLALGGSNVEIVWGSADRSAEKALVLETTMQARPTDTANGYDVSSPDAVVVW